MNKLALLRIVNALIILDFLATALSVALLKYSPWEALQGNNMLFEVHENAGTSLAILVILHVILNWSWIRTQYLSRKKK